MRGVVVWYEEDRRRGYLQPDHGGRELFIRHVELRDYEVLAPGNGVWFKRKGRNAVEVRKHECRST